MKGLSNNLKRFLGNKNTVTLICAILAIAILYFGYNWRVKQATDPIKVPFAKVTIQPRKQITEEMIDYMSIPRTMIKDNTIVDVNQLLKKYTNYNTMIPAGSLFYRDTVVDKKEMPDSAFSDIKDGYTVVSMPVNLDNTYGNSIYPGNYIDIYFKTTNNTGKIMLGKFIESIEVLDVRDSSGQHVFEDTEENRTPAYLLFAVPEKMHLLLRKAQYIGSAELIPVPRNAEYSQNKSDKTTNISSTYIENYVNSRTVSIPDESLPSLTNEE